MEELIVAIAYLIGIIIGVIAYSYLFQIIYHLTKIVVSKTTKFLIKIFD